jgi:hypothetical protein
MRSLFLSLQRHSLSRRFTSQVRVGICQRALQTAAQQRPLLVSTCIIDIMPR